MSINTASPSHTSRSFSQAGRLTCDKLSFRNPFKRKFRFGNCFPLWLFGLHNVPLILMTDIVYNTVTLPYICNNNNNSSSTVDWKEVYNPIYISLKKCLPYRTLWTILKPWHSVEILSLFCKDNKCADVSSPKGIVKKWYNTITLSFILHTAASAKVSGTLVVS